MQTVAIIGFGCAGYSAAKAIREHSKEYMIDIYSNTNEAPYNPMLTTYYVSGKISEKEMFPLGSLEEIQEQLQVHVKCSTPVVKLRAREKTIVTADGQERAYDYIVIASGARAVLPPIKGLPEHGIYTMRTAADARRLAAALDEGVRSAVVVGGQMVGIKVVELLHKRGIKTALVDMATQIFPLSAMKSTADVIEARLRRAGIELGFGSALTGVEETMHGLLSLYADGSERCSDIIVFCSGIKANIPFVDFEELDVGRAAIKTDLHMRTKVPGVYAVGDCCETTDVLSGSSSYIGLWANASLQGKVAGENICGEESVYQGNLIHNITHYMDTDFISIGDCRAEGEHVFWRSKDGSWQLEAILGGGRILGVNILDNADVSGAVKQVLLRRAAEPETAMTEIETMVLLRSGMPAGIAAKLGGAGLDRA